MDKLSVHHKSHNKVKTKKKPIKVVYISNPVRVKTSASKFKGLVQELTGQDSDINDISKFCDVEFADENPDVVSDQCLWPDGVDPCAVRPGSAAGEFYKNIAAAPFDMFDEVFMPEMLESFSGCGSSSYYYENLIIDTFSRLGGA